LISQSDNGEDWQARRRRRSLSFGRIPGASGQRSSTSPLSSSTLHEPHPPALHSYGMPIPARRAARNRFSPLEQANDISVPAMRMLWQAMFASLLMASHSIKSGYAILSQRPALEQRSSALTFSEALGN